MKILKYSYYILFILIISLIGCLFKKNQELVTWNVSIRKTSLEMKITSSIDTLFILDRNAFTTGCNFEKNNLQIFKKEEFISIHNKITKPQVVIENSLGEYRLLSEFIVLDTINEKGSWSMGCEGAPLHITKLDNKKPLKFRLGLNDLENILIKLNDKKIRFHYLYVPYYQNEVCNGFGKFEMTSNWFKIPDYQKWVNTYSK